MKFRTARIAGLAAATLAAGAIAPDFAYSQDKLKIAVSQKGSWDAQYADVAVQNGFFREQGIEASLLYTTGGMETVQAMTTGGVDIIAPTAIWSVIAAYAKGAPVRIISSYMYGMSDILWYVKADSPIRGPSDLDGKKIGYSRPGSVTHMGLSGYLDKHRVNATAISTGNPSATRTMVMTGQIDVGYTVAPVNLDIVRKGEIRLLFSGNDAPEMPNLSRTVVATSTKMLAERRDLVRRYLVAHRKAVDWVYRGNPDAALKQFAEENKIDIEVARDSTKYFGYETNNAAIRGLDTAVKQAVAFKLIDAPLTDAQKKELVDVVYDPARGN